jgi:hypothetical protein
VLERHALLPGERGTCLTTATLKPPLKDSKEDPNAKDDAPLASGGSSDGVAEARLYVVVGTAQGSDAGDEVVTRGRVLLFEVGDPSSRGAADGPLGPTLPSGMVSGASAAAVATSSGAAASPEDAVLTADDEDEAAAMGVGPRERSWLGATAAAAKGARRCMLVPSCAKALDGAALHVAQVL